MILIAGYLIYCVTDQDVAAGILTGNAFEVGFLQVSDAFIDHGQDLGVIRRIRPAADDQATASTAIRATMAKRDRPRDPRRGCARRALKRWVDCEVGAWGGGVCRSNAIELEELPMPSFLTEPVR